MLIVKNPKQTLDNRREYIEACVKIISMNWYLSGKTERPITDKQATIIALYLIYADFYDTKVGRRLKIDKVLRVRVSEILNFTGRSIDTHNLQLRKAGYIEKDDYTTDIKRMASEFTALRDELDREEGEIEILMTFTVGQ